MRQKSDGLIGNDTVPLPTCPRVGRLFPVPRYIWKVREYDEFFRAKSRPVIERFTQEEGWDYFNTYAPTTRALSICLLAGVAVGNGASLATSISRGLCTESPERGSVYEASPLMW